MNVLISSMEYPPHVGGGATYAHDLAHDLAAEGAMVTMLTAGETNEDVFDQDVRVLRRRSCADALKSGGLTPALINDTVAAIEAVDADVAHGHHTVPILSLKAIGEAYPQPSVFTQHRTPERPGTGIKLDGKGIYAEHAYRAPGSGEWIAPSHFFKERLVQAAVPERSITVIWPPVDYARFRPIEKEQAQAILQEFTAYGLSNYDPKLPLVVIPVVDRPRKDVSFALEAINALDSSTQVLITGVTYEPQGFAERVDSSRARFVKHPPLSDKIMPYLYNAADVVIMSSTHEGFGLAALEAAACGTPTCVRNSPGLQEIASQLPWMTMASTPQQMAGAIAAAQDAQPSMIDKKERHQAARSAFSPTRRAQQHLAVYERAINKPALSLGIVTAKDGDTYAVGLHESEDGELSIPRVELSQREQWHRGAARAVLQGLGIVPGEGRLTTSSIVEENARAYVFEALTTQGLFPVDPTTLDRLRRGDKKLIKALTWGML